MLSQTFSWPLVVGEVGDEIIACALPVAVDVHFDGRSEIRFQHIRSSIGGEIEYLAELVAPQEPHLVTVRRRPIAGEDDSLFKLDVDEWIPCVRRAVAAGKDLWRSKHGNHGKFRSTVSSASVTLDFKWADLTIPYFIKSMKLQDRSEESYLALVVLQRLLGRGSYFTGIVSGSIGERLHQPAATESALQRLAREYNKRPYSDIAMPEISEHLQLCRGLVSHMNDQDRNKLCDRIVTPVVQVLAADDASAAVEQDAVHQTVRNAIRAAIEEDAIPKEEPLLDYGVEPPKYVTQKVDWAFAAGIFTRFALPQGSEAGAKEAIDRAERSLPGAWGPPPGAWTANKTAEVSFGAKLSNLADIVMPPGWRQARYIRCPEIMWAIHTDQVDGRGPSVLDQKDPSVIRVLQSLKHNGPILDLREENRVTPLALASGLWYLNADPARKFRLKNRADIPPMFSWLFIRVIKEEQDSNFWEMAWDSMGAPRAEFIKFRSAPDTKSAADLLVKALNRPAPSELFPGYRPPDILVIVVPQDSEVDAKIYPSFNTLDIGTVLKVLSTSQQLRTLLHPGMQDNLGGIHIIIVPDEADCEVYPGESQQLWRELPVKDRELLRALSIFRWGFTLQMASLLFQSLGENINKAILESGSVREYLMYLEGRGLIRYGQGWYHLPKALRASLQHPPQGPESLLAWRKKLLRHHLAAGTAIAPYTVDRDSSSLPMDTSFQLEHMREAEYHFQVARSVGNDLGPMAAGRLTIQANRQLSRLRRFATPTSWSKVVALTGTSTSNCEAAYVMAEELLEARLRLYPHEVMHPLCYFNFANAAASWMKGSLSEERREELLEFTVKEGNRFEQALEACEISLQRRQLDEGEYDSLRARIASVYSNHLAREIARTPDDGNAEGIKRMRQRLAEMDSMIASLLEGSQDASDTYDIVGEWFERKGDESRDPREALSCCGLSIRRVPAWGDSWVKVLGCAALDRNPDGLEWVEEQLKTFSKRAGMTLDQWMAKLLLSLRGNYVISLAGPDGEQRWEAGIEYIQRKWGTLPGTAQALKEYEYARIPHRRKPRKSRPLTDVERSRMFDVLIGRSPEPKDRTAPQVFRELSDHLGYSLRDKKYNGFHTMSAMMDQFIKEEVIREGLSYGGNRTIYLLDEKVPDA